MCELKSRSMLLPRVRGFCVIWFGLLLCLPGCVEPSAQAPPEATGQSDSAAPAAGTLSTGTVGQAPAAAESAAGRIRVVATVGMVADLVRRVGGDRVHVTQVMSSGVDPHLYKPTTHDVRLIRSADIVFYAGLLLEGRMSDTLSKTGRSRLVVAVAEQIQKDRLLTPAESGGEHTDPHVWMDVATWSLCVDSVAETLRRHEPAHAAHYAAGAAELKRELVALHEYGRTCIQTIPPEWRILITSHDAFNYFGRAYGLEVIGVQGLSTESEAGLQRINELVDLIVRHRIPAVFVESSVSRKNMSALIDGVRSRGHQVEIGGELYSDAMGPENSYEGTYVGMLDHNFTTVTRGLGGTAPVGGMQGRLQRGSEAEQQP